MKQRLFALLLLFACIGASVLSFNQFKRKTYIGGTLIGAFAVYCWHLYFTHNDEKNNPSFYEILTNQTPKTTN
jgi:hypothetical protein